MQGHPVYFLVELTIHEGKVEEFKRTAEAMSEGTSKEPGALGYVFHLDEVTRRCRLVETYKDAPGVLAHCTGPVVQQLVPQMLQHAKLDRFEVYGDPGAQATPALLSFGATIYKSWVGFAR